LNTPEVVCSTSGTLAPAPLPAEGWAAKAEGLAGSGAGGGVDAWAAVASTLLIVSLPFGFGFFHEVGAELLVKIGPEAGR
jgi:hypothetical protein